MSATDPHGLANQMLGPNRAYYEELIALRRPWNLTATEAHSLSYKVGSRRRRLPFVVEEYVPPPLMPPLTIDEIVEMLPWARLEVPDAEEAVAFYGAAFGAEHLCKPFKFTQELSIYRRRVIISEVCDWKYPASDVLACWLKVEDVDVAIARAVEAGAYPVEEIVDIPLMNRRCGCVKDPFKYLWRLYEEDPWSGGLKGFKKLFKMVDFEVPPTTYCSKIVERRDLNPSKNVI